MKLRSIAAATVLALSSAAAMAAPTGWIDWTSSSSGTLAIGSTSVGVTLSGSAPLGRVDGDYYYNNSATGYTSPTGTYAGLKPSDLLQVNLASSFTLTFSQAILNPYIALVSVGGGVPVTYTFNGPVSQVVSAGNNYWGYGSYSTSGNSFTGREYNGVIQLSGSYTTLTVNTAPGEYWHAFNVGTAGVAAPVPEPETYAMLLAGLGLMGAVARRRRLAD